MSENSVAKMLLNFYLFKNISFTNKYLRVVSSLVISAKLTISNLEDKPIYRSFSCFDHLRVELESKIK